MSAGPLRTLLAGFVLLALSGARPALGAGRPDVIDHPEKIGIGTGPWGGVAEARMGDDLDRLGAAWFYTWLPRAVDAKPGWRDLRTRATFVPMIWGPSFLSPDALAAVDRRAPLLLGFNEPDNPKQSHMSVDEAVAKWPMLESLGMRLASPSPSSSAPEPAGYFLDRNSWFARFMAAARAKRLRVDVIALHYYTDDLDVRRMRADLTAAHRRYRRPIWLTEWALVDWKKTDRFQAPEIARFLRQATLMLDDLPFVERHAWFGMYAGGDGWFIGTELVDRDGRITPVGHAFRRSTRR